MQTPIAALADAMRRIADFLFGYDFFISYSHGDGMNYPRRLAERLEALHFKVFLDTKEYVAGTDLRRATRRRIRMSKKLVVVARERALDSEWVRREVDACLGLGRVPITVDVNHTLEAAVPDQPLKRRLEDKIYIPESLANPDAEPSDTVIQEFVRSFRATRQETLRMRVMSSAATVFLLVAAVAVWKGWVAEQQRRQAVSRQLATQAAYLMDERLDTALLLAATAQKSSDTFDSRDTLLRALQWSPRLLQFLHGPPGSWGPVALNGTGTLLVSVGEDRRIVLREVTPSGLESRILGESPTAVTAVAWSPDGRVVATAGEDGYLYFWDTVEATRIGRSEEGHKSPVASLVFTPDGRVVVSGAKLTEVFSWEVPRGRRLKRFPGLKSTVYASAVSPDGSQLAIAAERGLVQRWDLRRGEKLESARSRDPGYVYALAYSPDGEVLVVAGESGTLGFLNVESNKWGRQWREGHEAPVRRLAFSPDGERLASADADGRIFLWHGRGSPMFGPLSGHGGRVDQLAFGPRGERLVAAGEAPYLSVWDLGTEPPLVLGKKAVKASLPMADLALSRDGTRLAAASCGEASETFGFCARNVVDRWSLAGEIARLAPIEVGPHKLVALNFDRSGEKLLGRDETGAVIVWDARSGGELRRVESPAEPSALGFLEPWDRGELESASASMPADLRGRMVEAWRQAPLNRHKGGAGASAIDSRRGLLATLDRDDALEVWNLRRGHRIGRWPLGRNVELRTMAFAPNGRRLALGGGLLVYSDEERILEKSVEEGQLYFVDLQADPPALRGPVATPGPVYSLVYSRDGRLLALGGCGEMGSLSCVRGFVALRDTATGLPLGRPWAAHDGPVTHLAFAANGRLLVSGPREGMVMAKTVDVVLWDLRPEAWIERACRISRRVLDKKERLRYFGDPAARGVCGSS